MPAASVRAVAIQQIGPGTMSQAQLPIGYKQSYAANRLKAQFLPPAKLTLMLGALLKQRNQTEGDWGEIDAIADVLGKNEPPMLDKVLI